MERNRRPAGSIVPLQVLVETINWPSASVVDQFGVRHTVRADIKRAKGNNPAPGETWIIDRSLGNWTFAAWVQPEENVGDIPVGEVSALMLEDGFAMLLEDGGAILLEDDTP